MNYKQLLESQGFHNIKILLVHNEQIGLVVAKVIKASDFDDNDWLIGQLSKLTAPNPFVIKYIASKQVDEWVIILMDFANMKSIDHIIEKKQVLSPGTLRAMAKQLFEGLRLIHEINLVHQNIAPQSILLHYPESNRVVDVWSVGVILFQLAGHEHPVKAKNIHELHNFMRQKNIIRPSTIQDDLFWDLLIHLLKFDSDKRFSAAEALQHPYFTCPQAQLEISAEAKQVAASALQAQQNGDTSITIYDTNPSYTINPISTEDVIQCECGEMIPISRIQAHIEEHERLLDQVQPPQPQIAHDQQIADTQLTAHDSQYADTEHHFRDITSRLKLIIKLQKLRGKIKKIGRGRFGAVFSYQEIRTQRIVAIKECEYDTEEEKAKMHREIEVMKDIIRIIRQSTHQSQFIHVVEPLGFFVNEDEDKAYLVMELCSGGDLRGYIKNLQNIGAEIGAKKCWEFVSTIISAVYQLHVNGLIHGDLKPENVLLTDDIKVKLADFGLTRKLQQGREYQTYHGGTTFYLPPELLQDVSADLSELDIAHRIVNGEAPQLPSHYPDSLKNLIKAMLQKDPSRRISAEEILSIPEVAENLRGQ
ncbi:MAG: putative Serine/Threonine kinase domain protein [Streblomastix strix]|uniref:non-specific serine/threonine protein kinase n=1 Tax=Streblomastix strix TaxID=222440 RepID=A0A5J4VQ66_9EUKA|nr:MAG: putative Serine/Threonine kinase domain protein [Streblomastix strix]